MDASSKSEFGWAGIYSAPVSRGARAASSSSTVSTSTSSTHRGANPHVVADADLVAAGHLRGLRPAATSSISEPGPSERPITSPRFAQRRQSEPGIKGFFASPRNPFSRDGLVTRLAEHVPVVNNAMQGLHYVAGNEDAYKRACEKNPLAHSGYVTRGVERIPIVNNIVQGVHLSQGHTKDYERARQRNPLGHAGYITKAGEHIPVLADGIRCIHRFRGLEEDAERARAFSLQKLVGKKGAVTKLAQLLPGSNLVAAAIHEIKGDREEALLALDLVAQWKDLASADGALAKLAELIPGLDVVAFGLMVSEGKYASALRTICKTRWVAIDARSIVVVLRTDRMADLLVLDVESQLEINPKAASLAGGLLDVCIHLLDFNRHGERRRQRAVQTISNAEVVHRRGAQGLAQGAKVAKANDTLHEVVAYLTDQVPQWIGYLVDLANWSKNDWVASTTTSRYLMSSWRLLCPDMPYKPPPSRTAGAALAKAVQESIADVTVRHGHMPLNPDSFRIPRRRARERSRVPEAAAAVSCFSFVGCLGLGLHTGGLACVAGCVAGTTIAHRKLKENLISLLNRSNAAVWEWMSAPVTRLVPNRQGKDPPWIPACLAAGASFDTVNSGSSFASAFSNLPSPTSVGSYSHVWRRRQTPRGIIFDWSPGLFERLHVAEHLRNYFRHEYLALSLWRPSSLLYPMCWVSSLFERQLRTFANDALDGQTVPALIPIALPEGDYSGTWLPEIRVLLILWFSFVDQRYVTSVRVAFVDGLADQILNVLRSQNLPSDLRELDPRLADFTEPIELTGEVGLRWTRENVLKVELSNFKTTLHLPE